MHNHTIYDLNTRLTQVRNLAAMIEVHPDFDEDERNTLRQRARKMLKTIRRKLTDLQYADAEARREYIYAAAERIAEAASPRLIQSTQSSIGVLRAQHMGYEGDWE